MRSLAKIAREGELHRPGEGSSYPRLLLHLRGCACIAAEVVMLIEEKRGHSCKVGPIKQGKIPH